MDDRLLSLLSLPKDRIKKRGLFPNRPRPPSPNPVLVNGAVNSPTPCGCLPLGAAPEGSSRQGGTTPSTNKGALYARTYGSGKLLSRTRRSLELKKALHLPRVSKDPRGTRTEVQLPGPPKNPIEERRVLRCISPHSTDLGNICGLQPATEPTLFELLKDFDQSVVLAVSPSPSFDPLLFPTLDSDPPVTPEPILQVGDLAPVVVQHPTGERSVFQLESRAGPSADVAPHLPGEVSGRGPPRPCLSAAATHHPSGEPAASLLALRAGPSADIDPHLPGEHRGPEAPPASQSAAGDLHLVGERTGSPTELCAGLSADGDPHLPTEHSGRESPQVSLSAAESHPIGDNPPGVFLVSSAPNPEPQNTTDRIQQSGLSGSGRRKTRRAGRRVQYRRILRQFYATTQSPDFSSLITRKPGGLPVVVAASRQGPAGPSETLSIPRSKGPTKPRIISDQACPTRYRLAKWARPALLDLGPTVYPCTIPRLPGDPRYTAYMNKRSQILYPIVDKEGAE